MIEEKAVVKGLKKGFKQNTIFGVCEGVTKYKNYGEIFIQFLCIGS